MAYKSSIKYDPIYLVPINTLLIDIIALEKLYLLTQQTLDTDLYDGTVLSLLRYINNILH